MTLYVGLEVRSKQSVFVIEEEVGKGGGAWRSTDQHGRDAPVARRTPHASRDQSRPWRP
jgi:hypothetical protein